MRVVFARHLSLPNELAGVFQLRTAMAWQRVERVADVRPLFLRDSPDFQLVPELTPLPSEAVFDKLAMSMFVGTPLELVLRDCGINAFAIVGAVTEIGIEPTVRHGADLGFIPVVVADACGSVSFCGARDVYPDMRRMGYPFDRPFAGSISDTFMANDHLACRDLSIRRTPDQGLDG